MSQQRDRQIGCLYILGAALASATLPIFTRQLGNAGWDALQSAAVRSLVAAVILSLVLRRDILKTGKQTKWLLGNGVLLIFGSVSYIYAMRGANNGIVTAISFLGPVWIVCLEWGSKDPLRKSGKGAGVACALGCVGAMLVAAKMNVATYAGMLVFGGALVSSVAYAAALFWVKPVLQSVEKYTVVFWAHAVTALCLLPLLKTAPWSPETVLWSIAFGTVNGIGFFVLLYAGLQRLSSSESGIFSYTEMIFACLLSFFYFHEAIAPYAMLGILLILASGFVIWRSQTSSSVSS